MHYSAITNQVVPIPPIVCTSTHLASTLWDGGDFTWASGSWNIASTAGAATSTFGPPKLNWNASTNRPTSMHIGINIDSVSGMSFPTTIVIDANDSDGTLLGTANIVVTAAGAYTQEIILNWGGSLAGAGLGTIDFTPNLYCVGPRITCIEYVGAARLPITTFITITTPTIFSAKLKTIFDAGGHPALIPGDIVIFTLNPGASSIGSVDFSQAAVDTEIWPAGVNLAVFLLKDAVGAGAPGLGQGGGIRGGTAIKLRHLTTLSFGGKTAAGGGGSGSGTSQLTGIVSGFFCVGSSYKSGGGGGAGSTPGKGYTVGAAEAQVRYNGSSGTTTTGGAGGNPTSDPCQPVSPHPCIGGSGGALGSAGGAASDVATNAANVGGAAGYSIDGYSYLAPLSNLGTLLGPTTG